MHLSQNKLIHIEVEQDPSRILSAEHQHEQAVAIYDILDENIFTLAQAEGPYRLLLRTDMRHIHFDIQDDAGGRLTGFVLALGPFRRIMRDYGQVCLTYYEAIRTKSPSQIQAIDMGRRSLHNEGSELLKERLEKFATMDELTARRLFTLIFVMTARRVS